MYAWEKIKEEIVANINAVLGENLAAADDLIIPPKPEFGDLGIPLFALAKKTGKTPNEVSEAILNGIKFNETIIGAKAAGPYLNFFLDKKNLVKNVITEIDKEEEKFGRNKTGAKEKIVLEFSNVNTHKEYHVGHLRNICYGDAVTKILNANGFEAVPISYVNDFGIHVAKALWDYAAFIREKLGGKNIEALPEAERGFLLGKMYVDASNKEKDDPVAAQMIAGWKQKIENRSGEEYELWKKTRLWSIAQFDLIYRDLGVKFDDILYESDFVERGKEKVKELLKKGILRESEGAIIADLENCGLGVLVVIRSNGTASYAVGDLALAEEKHQRYKPSRSIYVVDIRQELYFRQLFKILAASGFKEKLIHLPFDFVKLPSGMMASRTGNVITYLELKNDLLAKCETETKKRHDDWPEGKIKENALKIGLGAAKFEMLKVGAKSIITFDIAKALSLEGYTSAYIQYAYARIKSILRKVKNEKQKTKNLNFEKLVEEKEIALIKKLAVYPEIVAAAGKDYDPSMIAKYVYEVAQMLNDYYHAVPVLQAVEEEIKFARLALLSSVAQVIKNGLNLLGIETVEEM
ncbi:MAG: arginine--tRNA ligase [Patescibacteria group bacterium]|nr:arginine--tRNA ligase [Patescibacteria group bacterium]